MNTHQEEEQIDQIQRPLTDPVLLSQINLDNAKEMLKEAEEQLDGLTKGRETVDQKITYFLGALIVVLSSVSGFGLKPFLKMAVDRNYLPLSLFLGFVLCLCAFIIWLAFALLPKDCYIKGLDPLIFWDEKLLTKPPIKMIVSICEQYQYMIDFMREVISKKGKALKWTVSLFAMFILVFLVCSLFLHLRRNSWVL